MYRRRDQGKKVILLATTDVDGKFRCLSCNSCYCYLVDSREKIAAAQSRDRVSAAVLEEITDDVLRSELIIVVENSRRYCHFAALEKD